MRSRSTGEGGSPLESGIATRSSAPAASASAALRHWASPNRGAERRGREVTRDTLGEREGAVSAAPQATSTASMRSDAI